jgi:hypothetical protein
MIFPPSASSSLGIKGGHADFSWSWDPDDGIDPTANFTSNMPSGGCGFSCRFGDFDQIHFNNDNFHLDTVGVNWAFPLGAILHGLIDVGYGNINPSVPIIP